jgi:dimethylhistidine N-methyltransferase
MQTSAQTRATPGIDPANREFHQDVVAGLRASPRQIPSKYFYDRRGSELFDAICELDEYYPTRTELAIMSRHAKAMADALGGHCMLIELGSGSSVKTRILLGHMDDPKVYVPVDISRDHLNHTVRELSSEYESLEIIPVCADFGNHFDIPPSATPTRRRVIYFPGSTIGNFEAAEAESLLARIVTWAGPGGGLLIGFDTCADRVMLEAAYNDRQGVTAAFNLNLLEHVNRELGGDFELAGFRHRAVYEEAERRMVMWLDSLRPQAVSIAGETFHFAEGEPIRTEYSHKYDLAAFRQAASRVGLKLSEAWADDLNLFAVALFTVED